MASLDLIPKAPVLVAQVGVFLANAFVIKKLFVEPYLSVRDRRDAATVGNQDSAIKILHECEHLAKEITAKVEGAYSEAANTRDQLRKQTIAKKNEIVKSAEEKARLEIEAIEKDIKHDLANERSKIPAIVNSLTQDFYQKTIS